MCIGPRQPRSKLTMMPTTNTFASNNLDSIRVGDAGNTAEVDRIERHQIALNVRSSSRGTFANSMKKRSGVRRAVPILEANHLAVMSTKQLLARLARLRFCEREQRDSDLTAAEVATVGGILFKNTPEWRAAYAELKFTLAMREHVPRPAERGVSEFPCRLTSGGQTAFEKNI